MKKSIKGEKKMIRDKERGREKRKAIRIILVKSDLCMLRQLTYEPNFS